VDKMGLPYDERPEATSGLRLGTPIVTRNGMGKPQMRRIAELFDTILANVKAVNENKANIDAKVARRVRGEIKELTSRFPMR
jgi:glycine hydroxymethyltransferase